MFIKIGEEAIINISDIVSVTKNCSGEYLHITLRNVEDGDICVRGVGKTIADRKADTNRTYNFIWDSICDYRSKQPDFDGIKTYLI